MGTVTLQTIAAELGVSRTTVSNAFSRPDQLSDELRQRILETAQRLGYPGPHPAARTLRRGQSGAWGMVLKESLTYAFADPYAIEFLGSFATETETTLLGLYLIPSPPGTEQVAGVRHAVVDAFCVFALPEGHPVVEAVLSRELPTVFVDGPRLEGHAFVGVDDRAAMSEMTRHLVELGHNRIDILTFRVVGDDQVGLVDEERLSRAEYRGTRERLRGALDVLRPARIEPKIYEVGVNTRESSQNGAMQLLAADDPPTAILCLSDQIALGAMDAAAELGISIPEELSITGYDDIPQAGLAGLTTVHQPAGDKGRAAAQLLQSWEPSVVILPHELIIRESTSMPAPS